MDRKINAFEVSELDQWVSHHQSLINRNPFREFMIHIRAALKDREIPILETVEDLFWLCQKYEGDNYYYDILTSDLQVLQGICHGILSDGVVNNEEIINLEKWLSDNQHLTSYYPYDEIRSLILTILRDGKIDQEERLILKAFINEFVNLKDVEMNNLIESKICNTPILGICTSEPSIVFPKKKICITGRLKRGSRRETQEMIESLGAQSVNSVSRSTDYLIVGDSGNPAWAFACYGRKVEQAIKLRKEGYAISIVHEFDFFDILDDQL